MHSVDLILTITGGLGAALVCGYFTHRIGLSPIVGYLLAGLLVGPYTPGYVADQHLAEQLAEIGVILLMFGVGLQFHIEELLAVRRIAIPGAVFQSLLATVFGALLAHGAGWSLSAGLVFGIALSVASTVVLIRVLTDYRALHTPAGHIAVGWLVVEDLFTVLVLVLMPAMFGGASGGSNLVVTTLVALVKVALLAVFTFYVGGRVLPWLLTRIAATHSRELFVLAVLAVALGIAVASAKLFGASMALGAFLAGMVVGRSEFSVRAASEALPMRDAFAVLFFVSVGMLLDPEHLLREPGFVLATLGVILLVKPLAALTITWLFGQPLQAGLVVAVALAQIGEFSFIVANLGVSLGVLTREATNTIVAASIVSITLNPLLFRAIEPVSRRLARRGRPVEQAGPVEVEEHTAPRHRAVVVGYGPIGRSVARLLTENDIEPVVIELNVETVRGLKEQGIEAVYGDASHLDTLRQAGVTQAQSLVLSVAGLAAAAETIRLARELNPRIQVIARTAYLREASTMHTAGADLVFSGEGEVALAVTEALLERLGATPEQIDRERARVHADLSYRQLTHGQATV